MDDSVKFPESAAPGGGGSRRPFPDSLGAFSRLVVKRFAQDQCLRIAAALSYTTLLALVPLMAIAFAILRAFPVFDAVQVHIKTMMFENFMPESVGEAQAYFDQFITQAENLTSFGIVGLAVTAIMLLSTIERALNDIFHVKGKRPFVPRLLMFWAVITLGPLLLGGSLSLGTYLLVVGEWLGADKVPGIGSMTARLLPTVLAISAFSLFYAIVPNRKVRVRDALIGGVAAGVLFGVVRKAFALYITAFPTYQTLYGVMSAVPIFLIWMYVSWGIVLIGAEIAANLPHWGQGGPQKRDATPPPPRP